jgi:hypothetical protein
MLQMLHLFAMLYKCAAHRAVQHRRRMHLQRLLWLVLPAGSCRCILIESTAQLTVARLLQRCLALDSERINCCYAVTAAACMCRCSQASGVHLHA